MGGKGCYHCNMNRLVRYNEPCFFHLHTLLSHSYADQLVQVACLVGMVTLARLLSHSPFLQWKQSRLWLMWHVFCINRIFTREQVSPIPVAVHTRECTFCEGAGSLLLWRPELEKNEDGPSLPLTASTILFHIRDCNSKRRRCYLQRCLQIMRLVMTHALRHMRSPSGAISMQYRTKGFKMVVASLS